MNRSTFLIAVVCALFAFGAGEVQAKKKKPPAEGAEIMCSGKVKKTFTGKLFSIQPAAREITIKTSDGSKEFRLAGNCKLSTKDKAEAQLTDLKLGDDVTVSYFTSKLNTEVACSVSPASDTGKKSSK